jgi:hypothetical protein
MHKGVYRRVTDDTAVVSMPKGSVTRSESYRRWVASLPCIACGISGFSQAAHPNYGRGLGQKSNDLDCFALCSVRPGHMGCHQMHDLLIDVTRDERRELEVIYTAKTRAMAAAANRPEVA